MAENERQMLNRRLQELKSIRSTHEVNWRDITDQMLPYRARWSDADHNKGEPLSTTLINNTPSRALRVLSAGLMAGITSPSRIWFHLTTSQKELNDKHPVRSYLDAVERIIRETLAQAGFYQSLADGVYRDLALIGTGATFLEEDENTRVRFEPLTIGEYFIDVDKSGKVDTLFRRRPMTVRQIVEQFGIDNVSPMVKRAFEQAHLGQTFNIVQAVYPNKEWKPNRADVDGKRFASRWFEEGSPHDREGAPHFLREGGYEEFPAMVPRWNPRAGEVWGRGSPGWEAVGDAKALQHLERRLAALIDKTANPPMRGSDAMRDARASLLPGDITYVPSGAGHVYEPAINIPPAAIVATQKHIQRHEQRINQTFFVDLWMSLLSDQRAQRPTATEVEARREEIMLQLGPLLENLNSGLLEPAVTRVFAILDRAGMLPEPPPELEGTEGAVKVEFISVLHQAQKMTGIVGVRELMNMSQLLAGMGRSDALDKLNVDEIMDELADMLGLKPELVLSDDQVQEIREAKAQQQQAQQQGEAMLKATEGARNLSGVDPQQMSELASTLAPAAAAGAQGGLGPV